MSFIARLFYDSQGKPSSKRVFGAVLLVGGVVLDALGVGDPETHRVMLWAGIAALGVGTLETRVSK